ncbi:ArnT family glycosyltransferase [Zunongwangia sp. H14]|uniref:ArnT family glycosyltransferase n=1 Tax=Zunongwangia sp. H14 TaxID=3240792 RepID=UPI00356A36E8
MDKKSFGYLLGVVLLLLITINFPGLTESSEARYAEIGMEMFTSGDFLHPRLLGILHFHKPPLTYLITSFGYQLFGVNEFGARFFLVFALAIQMWLIYRISWELYRDKGLSRLSMVLYGSLPLVLVSILNLTTDAFLNTFILAAIYCYLCEQRNKKKIFTYAAALLLGMGVLTKGPVAFLPFLIFVIFHRYFLKIPWKIGVHEILAVILCLLLSLSWFAVIIMERPALWDYFTNHQIKDRVMNAQVFHREESFWYYIAFIPLLCFPYFYIIIYRFFSKKKRNSGEDKALMWTIIILLFAFSCFSSKLILYLLPSAPFIAILGAKTLYYKPDGLQKLTKKILLILLYIIGIGGSIFLIIKQIYLPSVVLLFLLIFSLFWLYRKKSGLSLINISMGFTAMILVLYASFGFYNPSAINSYKGIFQEMENNFPDSSTLLIYDQLIPSAKIYTNKKVVTIHDNNYKTQREIQFESADNPVNYLDISNEGEIEDLIQELLKPASILMIRKKDLKDFPLNPQDYKPKKTEIGKWYFYSN